jgi:hypothetical protein
MDLSKEELQTKLLSEQRMTETSYIKPVFGGIMADKSYTKNCKN